MAQTTEEIFNDMSAAQATMGTDIADLQPAVDTAQTFLDDLASPSKVAEHRLIRWLVSRSIRALQVVMDTTRQFLTNLVYNSNYGHLRWYREEALKFQYGSSLSYIDGRYRYAAIIPSQMVVSHCSASESGNSVLIKTAKVVSGVKQELSALEHAAFREYIRFIRVAGVKVIFINQPADNYFLRLIIKYNPLVMAADGTLISDPGTSPVLDAIADYENSITFDGRIILNQVVDKIQLAQGVSDLQVIYARLEDYLGNNIVELTEVLEAKAKAGYITTTPILMYEPYV